MRDEEDQYRVQMMSSHSYGGHDEEPFYRQAVRNGHGFCKDVYDKLSREGKEVWRK